MATGGEGEILADRGHGRVVRMSVLQFPGVVGRKAAQSVALRLAFASGDPARIPAAGDADGRSPGENCCW